MFIAAVRGQIHSATNCDVRPTNQKDDKPSQDAKLLFLKALANGKLTRRPFAIWFTYYEMYVVTICALFLPLLPRPSVMGDAIHALLNNDESNNPYPLFACARLASHVLLIHHSLYTHELWQAYRTPSCPLHIQD